MSNQESDREHQLVVNLVITSDHIRAGEQASNSRCAIALALMDDPDILRPRVTEEVISFSYRLTGLRYTWNTPRNLQKFISHFDRTTASLKGTTATLREVKATKVVPIQRTPTEKLAGKRRRWYTPTGKQSYRQPSEGLGSTYE